MNRQIPVLVYGDCPELQACKLQLDTTEISEGDLRSSVDETFDDYELIVIAVDDGDEKAVQCVRFFQCVASSCPTVMVADPQDVDIVEEAIEVGLTDYVLRNGDEEQQAFLLTHTIDQIRRHTYLKERFHESERRFWTFFDHAPIGLLVFALNGQCEHANQAFGEMVGYSLDELRSMTLGDLVADEDIEIWNGFREELQQGDRDLMRVETRLIHETGEDRWAKFCCVVMRNPDGEPSYCLGMATDLTDRKRIQENLEYADKMRAMGRLAGGVAHDFNNLLTIINSHSFIMEDSLDDPERLTWSLDRITEATARGSKLTRQLLTFGRHHPGETEAVDPNELIEEMDVVLESLFGSTVQLDIALGDDLRAIETNRDQIEQVITNLALNARDAMAEGGRFSLRTYNLDVDVPSSTVPSELPRGQYTVIEVADTGCGMEPEVQKQAFEPFFTTKEVGEGTGLGLSTVYGVVTQCEGHVTLDSEPGEGTRFRLYFPSAKQDSDTPPKLRRARKGTPTDGSETILLVEDEEELREPLMRLLDSKGYNVMEASDAEEALDLSEQYRGPIHLLLTDVIMPGIDGVSLADRITDSRPDTAVILMSGYTADALSMESDIIETEPKLLQKPFGMDLLSRTIRRILNPS